MQQYMTKKKLYQCSVEGCTNQQQILSKGKCNYHRSLELRREKEVKEKAKTNLDAFYDEMVRYYKRVPFSEESGNLIENISRTNIAHILPKGKFADIATDPQNVVLLTWQEHHDFDKYILENDFERLEKEFPMLSGRLKIIIPKLLERTKNRNKLYYNLEKWLEKS